MKTYRLLLLQLLFVPLLMGSAPENIPEHVDTIFSDETTPPISADWTPQYVHVRRSELTALAASYPAQMTCLAQAVYFEARGEPLNGQFAVAEVVLNRVDDPRYPDSVCDVVFQNETWKHRCQFSFACDGRTDTPRHTSAWFTAQMVAALAAEDRERAAVGSATHYHAVYVQPTWAASLQKTTQLGRHFLYSDFSY
jgi:spore germination cell wall hydrolase CwlJ-like protein